METLIIIEDLVGWSLLIVVIFYMVLSDKISPKSKYIFAAAICMISLLLALMNAGMAKTIDTLIWAFVGGLWYSSTKRAYKIYKEGTDNLN